MSPPMTPVRYQSASPSWRSGSRAPRRTPAAGAMPRSRSVGRRGSLACSHARFSSGGGASGTTATTSRRYHQHATVLLRRAPLLSLESFIVRVVAHLVWRLGVYMCRGILFAALRLSPLPLASRPPRRTLLSKYQQQPLCSSQSPKRRRRGRKRARICRPWAWGACCWL